MQNVNLKMENRCVAEGDSIIFDFDFLILNY